MEVVVEDKQLSLAIGKKGQNVRLAAKLTGWRIDIKSGDEGARDGSPGRAVDGGDQMVATRWRPPTATHRGAVRCRLPLRGRGRGDEGDELAAMRAVGGTPGAQALTWRRRSRGDRTRAAARSRRAARAAARRQRWRRPRRRRRQPRREPGGAARMTDAGLGHGSCQRLSPAWTGRGELRLRRRAGIGEAASRHRQRPASRRRMRSAEDLLACSRTAVVAAARFMQAVATTEASTR